MSERFRCFVAVGLPATLREEIGTFLARESGRAGGVTWVRPDLLHFTLKFLGEVETARLPAVAGALDEALAGAAPFAVSLRGAGAFPTPARPRVVWIGAGAGGEALVDLARRTEAAVASLGFPAEERPFAPHLTIGRVKAPPRDPAALPGFLGTVRDREWGVFLVPAVHLMRSVLFPSGPTYSILRETCLTGTPGEAEGAHR